MPPREIMSQRFCGEKVKLHVQSRRWNWFFGAAHVEQAHQRFDTITK
jgi:hypothetical protein